MSSCLANFRLAVLNEAGNDIFLFVRVCIGGYLQSAWPFSLSFQALVLQRPYVVLLNADEDEPEAGK